MVAGFVSYELNMTKNDIADYVASNIKDSLSRSSGVGEVTTVRCSIRDAYLAGSEQAEQLPTDYLGRDLGHY